MIYFVIFMIALLVLSFIFSSSETAIFSLQPYRLTSLSEKSRDRLFYLIRSPTRLLITIVLSNTLVNVLISGIYERIIPEDISIIYSTIIIAGVIMVFGEYIPKIIAIKKKLLISSFFSILILYFYRFFLPLSYITEKFIAFFERGKDRRVKSEELAEEIILVGYEDGTVENVEYKLSKAFSIISQEKLKSIMKPRTELIFIEEGEEVDAVLKKIPPGIKRVPIYKENIDNIRGIIDVKNIIFEHGIVKNFVATPYFLNEESNFLVLLKFFRRTGAKAVFIIDEYGGISGMIDIEDIEKILLQSLNNIDEEIKKINENEWEVCGSIDINKLKEILPDGVDYDRFSTISGLIMNLLGRVPVEGEVFSYKNLIFMITDVRGQKINKLRVRKRD